MNNPDDYVHIDTPEADEARAQFIALYEAYIERLAQSELMLLSEGTITDEMLDNEYNITVMGEELKTAIASLQELGYLPPMDFPEMEVEPLQLNRKLH